MLCKRLLANNCIDNGRLVLHNTTKKANYFMLFIIYLCVNRIIADDSN